MATNELQFQSELVHAVNASGGHAFKLASPFFVGRADLYVRVPWHSIPALIEVKWQKDHPRQRGIKLSLTENQKKFLIKERLAGGVCGWVIGGQESGGQWSLAGTCLREGEDLRFGREGGHPDNLLTSFWIKPRGKSIDTQAVLGAIWGNKHAR